MRGFSLIELILVLAIMGTLVALVAPSFSGSLESARLRGSAADVRSTLALARTLAVSEARTRSVVFDPARGEYGIEGEARKYTVPDGVRLAALAPDERAGDEETVRVRFYPDGSADGDGVAISSTGGGRILVSVEPLTGSVRAGT